MAKQPDGRTVVVQCKRYAVHRSVRSPDMQKFLTRRGVRLVDRQQLAEWMAGRPAVSV